MTWLSLWSFRDAIEQLCMFKQIERRPMAWPCQLTVGSCLSIRIVGYKAVSLSRTEPDEYTLHVCDRVPSFLKNEAFCSLQLISVVQVLVFVM